MGCDIHMYIEHRGKRAPDDTRPPMWWNFGNRFNPGRDYEMFAVLAGVRTDDESDAAIPPRGILPYEELGWDTRRDCYLRVEDNDEADDAEGSCTRASASGYGTIIKVGETMEVVAHPDMHTHSWLTPMELQMCYLRYKGRVPEGPGDEYLALLAAAEKLEGPDKEVRIVFWFDN